LNWGPSCNDKIEHNTYIYHGYIAHMTKKPNEFAKQGNKQSIVIAFQLIDRIVT